jgi:hypothetical protein
MKELGDEFAVQPQPDFYEALFGTPYTNAELDDANYHVRVEDIDTVLAKARMIADCEVLAEKMEIVGLQIALIQCPDQNIVFILEIEKPNDILH